MRQRIFFFPALITFAIFCLIQPHPEAAQENQIASLDNLESRLTDREEARNKIKSLLNDRESYLLSLDLELSYKLQDEEDAGNIYEQTLTNYKNILSDPYTAEEKRKETLKQTVKLELNYGKYEDAYQDCLKLWEQYPQDKAILELLAEAYNFKANNYIKLSDLDSAINQYDSILNLPNLSTNWYAFSKDYLAYLYILKGEDDKAKACYQSIIDDYPELLNWSASARFSLGRYHIRKNNIPKAKEQLQAIIKSYPASSWAKPAQDTLRSLK